MGKKGLIIGRFQPPHKGHLSVFEQMDEECDSIIIGIGSAQTYRGKDNPLSGGERIALIRRILDKRNIGPYEIYPIPDIYCYPAWPYYVMAILPPFDCLYAHSGTVLRLFEGKAKLRKVEEFHKDEWSATEIRRRIREGKKWKHLVPEEVAEFLEEINMKERIKPIIGMESETEKKAAHLLTEKEMTIATAESCTGGLVADRLTNVPGSSSYFERGLVTYSSQAKTDLLGVGKKTIEEKGVVSKEVASQMAEGIRKKSNVDLGLATTGIMGPGGGTKEKPVGTVCLGLAHRDGTEIQTFHFSGNRLEVKEQTSERALQLVIDFLKD